MSWAGRLLSLKAWVQEDLNSQEHNCLRECEKQILVAEQNIQELFRDSNEIKDKIVAGHSWHKVNRYGIYLREKSSHFQQQSNANLRRDVSYPPPSGPSSGVHYYTTKTILSLYSENLCYFVIWCPPSPPYLPVADLSCGYQHSPSILMRKPWTYSFCVCSFTTCSILVHSKFSAAMLPLCCRYVGPNSYYVCRAV